MAKTKAQIEFEANTSKFTSGIKSMDQSLGTLRKELKLNSTELKGNADDVDLLAQRKEILQRESEASANKVDLLSKKLNEAERLFGSSSNEVRQLNNQLLDAKNVFQGIQNEITQTDSKIEQLSDEFKENKQRLKEVEQASQELEGGFSVLKGAVGELLADGIQRLSGELKDLAIDNDTAMSSFQAQTGLSTEAMGEFESAMENIYANNFGESLNDIANAMAEVKQQTKETDPSKLQKMTEHALTLRDTFDMDVAESMRAVNSLMNQFGLDSDQAFNLVVQGAQSGLNANGDMLDVINEYSVQFKNAGFSANDMFNMLLNGAESGTWSVDKLGDAVKEMNIRFSDGTVEEALKDYGINVDDVAKRFNAGGETSKQAMNEVMNAIMSVDDETERYKLGVQVFGTMWEDLGEQTVTSLMDTEGGIDSAKQSMEELTQVKYDNITSQLGEISRGLKEDILIPIAEDLLPVLKDGLGWLKNNLSWLVPTITGIGIAIATYFVISKFMSFIGVITQIINLVRTGTSVMGALNVVMGLNPITLIVAAIVGLIAVFVLLWNKCDGFREFWINLWNKIKEVFGIVVEGIKTGFQVFKDFISNVIEGIKTGFQNFMNFLGTIADWINTNVIQPVISFFQSLWNGIQAVWDGIIAGINFFINLVVAIFTTAFQIITLPFQFIWQNCKDTVMTVFDAIKNFIMTVFNAISSFFTTIFGVIKTTFTTVFNAIKNVVMTVFNAVKSFITTVWNGIKSAITTVINAIKTIITTVFEAIKNTISTIINTIKTVITTVFEAIKSVVTTIWNGIKEKIITPISNAYDKVKTTVSNIKDKVVDTFNNVKDKVTTIFNNVKDAIWKPIEKAKTKVKEIVDKIKGFFDFEFKLPDIKTPHFGISPEGWKVGDLLDGVIPKLSIDWHAKGGIFTKPTIIHNGNTAHGFGENGAEAILPIEKLEGWMNNGFNQVVSSYYNNERINRLVELAEEILDKPTDIYMDKKKVGQAMAETNDGVSGQRVSFKERGLII